MMTSDQISAIRTSWLAVAVNADALTTTFYAYLFEIDATAARLFRGTDMSAQPKKLTQSLDVVVHALDDLDILLPAVAALGRRHASYGVEDHHFDGVGEALLKAMADVCGESFTPELRDAWASAYALVSSVMRRAIAREASRGAASLTSLRSSPPQTSARTR